MKFLPMGDFVYTPFFLDNLHKGHILPNLMVVKSNFGTETGETAETIQPEQISFSFIALGHWVSNHNLWGFSIISLSMTNIKCYRFQLDIRQDRAFHHHIRTQRRDCILNMSKNYKKALLLRNYYITPAWSRKSQLSN